MTLFIISFILVVSFLFILYFCICKKYAEYSMVPASYVLDDVIEITLSDSELAYIQKNQYVFYNSRKEKIEFVSIIRNAYKGRKRRNQVLLRLKLDRNEENLIYISIFRENKNFIDLLVDCWKE